MELNDYIDMAVAKCGSIQAVADAIGTQRENLSAAKRGKRGIGAYPATRLAQIVGVEPLEVIAASELVTEKNEERRKFWSPFVEHARAACLMAGIAIVMSILTPSPVQASENEPWASAGDKNDFYYVKLWKAIKKAWARLASAWRNAKGSVPGILWV